ncbi:MAG: adenylate/guanylate cyclase domain-containing protein [Ignavibacteriaceae bacterium]|jgi:adenylate cyclase
MKKEIRMLAAIMFTDMVGYTIMMQEDERKAKALRDRHREVLQNLTTEHNGQILQYYGDGTLTIFGSAIEATICGARIQQELQRDPKVPLRIGIHAGDIVYDDEGVYGDGVNVASRIENLALPGSVLLSGKVNEELKNQSDVSTKELGSFTLKNVRYPVRVYSVSSHGIPVPTLDEVAGKIHTVEHSIAVLPFVNMSTDKENEYFSDGITEEILNTLAKVDGLMITSRTSCFAFKGKNEDIRAIGKQLGVKNVLEGSVRKHGNKVRVTAQLINVEDGYHKWSEVYDRNLEDIFAVQDEIATSITKQLKKTLNFPKASHNAIKAPTENLEAYNLYLKGMFQWNKWSPENARKAIKLYEEAIKLEPGFALPFSMLSACYVFLGAIGAMQTKIAYPKSKELALKALELDDMVPDTHVSLGVVKFFYDWDWEGSEKCFLKAIELNPNSALGHQYYAMLLTNMGYHKKALKEAELAYQLDPLNAPVSSMLAFTYYNNNLFDDALTQYKTTKELDSDFHDTSSGMAWIYFKKGESGKAIELFKELMDLKDIKSKAIAGLGYVYAKTGETSKALKCIQELEDLHNPELPLDIEFAIINIGLGNLDKAFNFIDEAYEKRLPGLNFIKSRYWREIQDDLRYKELIKKMGLPDD